MESVNLDMEDIFEEAAEEDDFPTVGPLPDLPDRDEEPGDGEQNDDNTDVMSKLKDLSKGAAKKVVRKPMPKLDSQRLSGDRGIPILPKVFEKVQFKGKGNEAQDLRIIMRYLEHWAHRLFPMMPFDEVLERIEKLGTKREVQTCIKKMRLDMPLLNDDYIQNTSDQEGETEDNQNPQKNGNEVDEDAWDEMIKEHEEEEQRMSQTSTFQTPSDQSTPMSQLKSQLSKPLMDLNNSSTSQPYTATPIASSSSTAGCLTPEQKERMERNRQMALQKKLGKQGFKTPAVPASPFRTPQSSSPVISRMSPSKPTATVTSPLHACSLSKMASPCKTPTSSPRSQSFSSLVQNGTLNGDDGVPASNTLPEHGNNKLANGESQIRSSEDDFSEVIPVIKDTKVIQNGLQIDDDEMSEVIPNQNQIPKNSMDMSEVIQNQDHKRNLQNCNDTNLVKKQKLNSDEEPV